MTDVAVQQQEPWQRQGMGIEQGFFGMFAIFAINYLKKNKLENI